MFRIRTKLLLLCLSLIILLNGVAYFLYHSGQESLGEYNHFLKKFYLLNDTSQKTDEVYQTLHSYVIERTPNYYEQFLDERLNLKSDQEKLKSLILDDKNQLLLQNYYNMITSFLEESGIVADAFQKQNIDVYSAHLSESDQIRQFIHENTLNLINDQLTNYRTLYKNMEKKNHYLNLMGVFIFISTIILSLIFSLWFSRGITKPIASLTMASKEISKGRFDGPPVVVDTKDEMQFLATTFNNMKGNIQGLIEEIKEKAALDHMLKEMELKNLQNQINPHFLFNVLNIISKKAYLEGAEESSRLMDSVAALLRYNLGKMDKPVTLGQEIDIIKEYFYIQKSRFGDRIAFQIITDGQCEHLKMPNFTLQPIVENAFNHGVSSIESGGRITIHIKKVNDGAIVSISDNGVGMDEVTRALLMDDGQLENPQYDKKGSTGIGFHNVVRRLRLFFGKEDVVEIHSKPGEGTMVILNISKI